MLNLAEGIRAWLGWRRSFAQQREHGRPTDISQLRTMLRQSRPEIDMLLSQLHRDGVAEIENYWSAERCQQARAELDALMQRESRSVRRFSQDSDRRLFGAEIAGPNIRDFHDDAFLRSVGEAKGGFALYNLATLGARIDATPGNRGSGEGWHRDAFGYQFKAILYLCDVDDENGPFEYVPGSHTIWRAGLDAAQNRFPAPPQSRIDHDMMENLIARGLINPMRFKAKAGTVILANTTGVHRGAPLKRGIRYALTNYYYFPHQIGAPLIDKFEPLAPGVRQRLDQFASQQSSET